MDLHTHIHTHTHNKVLNNAPGPCVLYMHIHVDWVVASVVLRMVDDLLSVVQHKPPKQNQTSVHIDGVQA